MCETRNTKDAVLKGMRLRCPNCGEGHLFSGYLKVAPACERCGLDFTPQRADDGPAYIVILLVCHIFGVALHLFYQQFLDNPLMLALILSAVAIVMSLAMLPPVKGMMVAIQWAKGMHGFGAKAD
ncbi:DUF983 domain-containing protein [Marivivens donghaensis]|uniref:DUF983 domain-containing protein n=1 Tax=Marivivens donghaensis TaxID=1699413 RepID=A0ABX0VWK1_9RHOB|nr:DUF983 domain-containing protein [Marivivens donghaensis]NIY72341.1 DUF983 domain-containing protein [Marivivens donghaensis]